MMFDLTDRVALVTGASRGIGRAIALKLAAQGATVVAAGRGGNAATTAAAIVEQGGRAEAVDVDVTDSAALAQLPGAIVRDHGRLDVVVSNAGITRDQLLMRMKREEWDTVIATNLTSVFRLSKGVLKRMMKERRGRIVSLTSIVGLDLPNLTGGKAKVLPNHHLTKPVLIGEIQSDGQFEVVSKTDIDVPGDAWSDVLPEDKGIEADWTDPVKGCGHYDTATKTCGAAPTP